MQPVIYDGNFEGWLTAVFEIYEHRFKEVQISKEDEFQPNIFGSAYPAISDQGKAKRVWAGLKTRLSPAGVHQVYQCWLSEIPV
jgi:probable DNA metabolism protein